MVEKQAVTSSRRCQIGSFQKANKSSPGVFGFGIAGFKEALKEIT